MIKEWKQFGLIKVKMNLDYKNWHFYHKDISIQFVSVLHSMSELDSCNHPLVVCSEVLK